jgi:hypothetical protein
MERVAICLRVVLGFFSQAGRIKEMVVAIMGMRFVHGSVPPQGFMGGFYRKNKKVLFIIS